MQVGFNLAWSRRNYGGDFGPAPYAAGWPQTLPTILNTLHDAGVSVVRWFILGNATHYGPDPTETPMGYEFTPPAQAEPKYAADFEQALQIFQNSPTGIKLIPSFCDFKMCGALGQAGGGGRKDLVRDPAKRDVFFDTLLEPLLQVAVRYKEVIYAFEVMNEPTWLVRIFSPPIYDSVLPMGPLIQPELVKAFLREAIRRITRAGLDSTVGHRSVDDFDNFGQDCTGTKRQFHFYPALFAEKNDLPSFQSTKAFLGEISSRTDDVQGNSWDECNWADWFDATVVSARLQAASNKGYELTMLWPDSEFNADGTPADDPKLYPVKLKDLKKFANP